MDRAALVFHQGEPITVAGLTLTERAVLLARRAGLAPVYVWGPQLLDAASLARLRAQGATPQELSPGSPPLEQMAPAQSVVLVGANVLFGPDLLAQLPDRTGAHRGDAVAASETGTALLLHLPAEARASVHGCRSLEEIAARLAARNALAEFPANGHFYRRIARGKDPDVEREYIRYLTGRGESYFTKKIRRFSVPLSTWLVRIGAGPTQVTLGGLVLAVASAWLIARGSYVAGLFGAVLYYTSMIFDCSDGEVARVTVREDAFGAWLETAVDYITYLVILVAITMASRNRAQAEAYRTAAAIAFVGTMIVIAIAGYLRFRVAVADPGQFDDASAKAMASASRVHRFARWSRQWIKRSSLAHLIVFLALVDQLPILLYLWAFGATVASFVLVIVSPFVVHRVAVEPAGHVHG
jgi:phosphatidylglycerophosphate synthase